MSDYIPIKGYIYLLKLCDTSQRIIYKVGKSINFYKRFSKYNYAEILMFISSDDITKDENEIINIFNINCKLDKGREFFLAKDDFFVFKLFIDYFTTKNNININTSNIVVNTDNRIIESVNNINTIENISIDNIVNNNILNESVHLSNIVDDTIDDTIDDTNEFENIENKKILEKTCPICNKFFDFPSRLKSHFENTLHCKKTDTEIKSFFIKFEKQINFKCEICFTKYTKKQNLKRHIESTQCKQLIKKKNLLNEIENIKLEISKL